MCTRVAAAPLLESVQSSMKEQLHLQHQELEDMRKRFLQVEEQHSLQKQLGEIKVATQRYACTPDVQ